MNDLLFTYIIRNTSRTMYSVKEIITKKFSGTNSCGGKISQLFVDNLIRVACKNITQSDDENCAEIKELLSNSIDAIRSKKKPGSKTIGKFGFGFFTILGLIYGNQDDYITIDTTYWEDGFKRYRVTIRDKSSGDFYLELENLEAEKSQTEKSQTGTEISIFHDFDCAEDIPFDINHYMSYITDINITYKIHCDCCKRCKNQNEIERTLGSGEDFIFLTINRSNLSIRDNGIGIHPEVLFNCLVVPSISSKVKSQCEQKIEIGKYENKTGIRASERQHSQLDIIVGDIPIIIIYANYSEDAMNYILSMPEETNVTLDRKDIILESSGTEIKELFANNLRKLIDNVLEATSDLSELWSGLKEYIFFTESEFNKNIIRKIMEETLNREDLLFVSCSDKILRPLINILSKCGKLGGRKIVKIKNADPLIFEQFIIDNIGSSGCSDIWWGKIVFKVEDLECNITSGGFSKLVFVNKRFTEENPLWINDLSFGYIGDKLYPYVAPEILETKKIFLEKEIPNSLKIFYQDICSLYIAMSGSLHNYVDTNIDNFFVRVISVISKLIPGMSSSCLNVYLHALYRSFNKLKPNTSYGQKPGNFYMSIPSGIVTMKTTGNNFLCCDSDLKIILWANNVAFKHKTMFWPLSLLRDSYLREHKTFAASLFDFCDKNLVTPAEELVMRDTFHLHSIKTINLQNLFRHALEELRSRFSSFIENCLEDYVFVKSSTAIRQIICEPLLLSLSIYEKTRFAETGNLINHDDLIIVQNSDRNTFTGKQLLNMIFDGVEDLTMAHKYSKGTHFQIFENVINSGTTKECIPAILTELIQNSIDAIRTKGGLEQYISIGFSHNENENILSFQDFIGIHPDNIIYMLLPFLSSKKSTDTVGFMGTGLFNIYRQPFCEKVFIQTITEFDIITVQCTPILEEGKVTDIFYEYVRELNLSKHPSGTLFLVYLKGNSTDLLIDISLFVHRISSQIEYPIIFNGIPLEHKDHILIYEDNKISFKYSEDSCSCILTEGVPYKYYNLNIAWANYIPTGLLINLKIGSYFPFQNRTSIRINVDTYNLIQIVLCWLIVNNKLNKDITDIVVPFFYSNVDYTQCIISTYYMNKVVSHINNIITKLDGRIPTWHLIKSFCPSNLHPIQINFIWKWFSNKKAPSSTGKILQVASTNTSSLHHIQRFVNIYWSIGKFLESKDIISGTQFSNRSDSPSVNIVTTKDYLGCYVRSKHIIEISSKDFDVSKFNDEINILSSVKDMNKRQMLIRELPTLSYFFVPTFPMKTLIHELTHAHRPSFPDGNTHCDYPLTIRGTIKNHSFDEGGLLIASIIAEYGLYSKFSDF